MRKIFIFMDFIVTTILTGCGSTNTTADVNNSDDVKVEVLEREPKLLASNRNGVEVYYAPCYYDAEYDDWAWDTSRYMIKNYELDQISFYFDTLVPEKKDIYICSSDIDENGYFKLSAPSGLEKLYIKELDIYIENPKYIPENIDLIKITLNDNGTWKSNMPATSGKQKKIYLLDESGTVVGLSTYSSSNSVISGVYTGVPVTAIYNYYSGLAGDKPTNLKIEYVFNL